MRFAILFVQCIMQNLIGVSVCLSLLGVHVVTLYLSCLVPALKLKFFPLVKCISLITHALIS